MAEWSIAAVLKTVEVRASGGSNPSLSAEKPCKSLICKVLFVAYNRHPQVVPLNIYNPLEESNALLFYG